MRGEWITATINADSINPNGIRVTSWVLRFPRMVLAEYNTHRALSRNSASSRAIPHKKMLRMVMTDPFIPRQWMRDHSGMQGNSFFKGFRCTIFRQLWLTARNFAVLFSIIFSALGLTKQISNRLLEAFMWHTVITTATDWENFFALRAEQGAEIHIRELAYIMLEEYNMSEPRKVEFNEWHIPFGAQMPEGKLFSYLADHFGDRMERTSENPVSPDEYTEAYNLLKLKIATARCARVSYQNFLGKEDYKADVALYDRLASMGHLSPFEHCAQAVDTYNYVGNFRGWLQIRKTIINENKKDGRVIKKV